MQGIIGLFSKTGTMGAVVAAIGRASCFPALGTLGTSLGLGFLAQFEGVFINTLLPVFAWVALAANGVSIISHRRWIRLLAGIAGPSMVLISLYPLWQYPWSTYLFYTGLLVMLLVAIWDIVSPASKRCAASNSSEAVS